MSSSVNNLEYLYTHLPARNRGTDTDQFVKRLLTFFGKTVDEWDELYETFFLKIRPDTAPEEFIDYWLFKLFGWSWYPKWFTVEHKRRLYRDFAVLLAKRGTALGNEDFLRHFSIHTRWYAKPLYWGDFVWGEEAWTVTEPLGNVCQVSNLIDEVNTEVVGQTFGEFVWGEGYFSDTEATLTKREIEDLIRFCAPLSQTVMVEYQVRNDVGFEAWDSLSPVIDESRVPDELTGNFPGE